MRPHRPIIAWAEVAATGFLVLTIVLAGIGLFLTEVLVQGPVGRWDHAVSAWFVEQRTSTLNELTAFGSRLGDTVTVIVVASVAVVVLAIRRHWAHIGFLVGALVIEVTTFVATAFIVERPRPDVPHLDAVPPTSSFPSGHAAAAIVLYVGLALIISSLVQSRIVRVLAWTVAVTFPVAVALSRLYRGMHHPTDVIASALAAFACLAFALLATRTATAVAEARDSEDASVEAALQVTVAGAPDARVVGS